ncbi:TBC1 domain family member 1 isoform X2 [Coccinella septempunctata]|uniref:TBC1 domain family member 1 isoform X2 n=1 Tax=Coccinella septempunctata TaxID=41139 RepID=UPI001D0624A2|nr:TBC1 domain family member 1 isoform X2 [Coccinella septempunctata]
MIGVPVGFSPYSSHSDASLMNRKKVAELYKQMNEQTNIHTTRSLSSTNLTSLCTDISPSLSNFFEVLYVGNRRIEDKNVPETFIDDSIEKFRDHDREKKQKRLLANIGRLKSEDLLMRRGSADSAASETSSSDSIVFQPLQRSISSASNLGGRTPEIQSADEYYDSESKSGIEDISHKGEQKDDDDQNRTMLLQVDKTDLRLISPDRKKILMHKSHKESVCCLQGLINKDHFCFICKETKKTHGYIGYFFRCKSDAITSDTVAAINQAFTTAESRPKTTIISCDHCPMVWFHKLCTEIENLSDKKTQAAILRKIEQFDEEEQKIIMMKFGGAETNSIVEQNEFLMMLLRTHCEMKQARHVHDSAENRSEFLNQYLGGSAIFTKAKRSISNSFEMLKKRASRDDFSATLREMKLPLNRESSPYSPSKTSAQDLSDRDSEGMRSRSSTIGSQQDSEFHLSTNKNSPEKQTDKSVKSPMMDIFFKVGSPKSNKDEPSPKNLDGSWRQAIFKKVVSPNKKEDELHVKKTREELRELWKKAIHQAILLVRMEKENATLRAKQEESAVKRIKLEYDEMKPNEREVSQVWDLMINKDSGKKVDKAILYNSIRQGIPRGKRGEAWQFLAYQFCMTNPPIDTSLIPHYDTPYETLLKELTLHQHAILIDLGRTFPNHSYFSSPLGPGQLALFNLLKAYSLLDPEVGYCQGLSFVVGVLLLHMEEAQAFFLLRHLMFRRDLRKQYLPDMTGLQIRLFQLSRLIHDKLPELYEHFNNYDISPTLYAAPWILTIFASQFPLGFVTRVFDLLFMEGLDVVFNVALALLTLHKDNLLKCSSFEEIMDYLKITLTQVDKPMLEKIMKMVYITDITKQLFEYKVEYHVLQEEMMAVQPQVDQVHKLDLENKRLREQNKKLQAQLDQVMANYQGLETMRKVQQSELNKQDVEKRGLEVTITTLGHFINDLIEEKKLTEIPGDVRRIVSEIIFLEKKKHGNLPQRSRNAPPNKPLIKSQSTGRIQLSTNNHLEELRFNSLNLQTRDDLQRNVQRTSNFFSNQHNNILKQKLFHTVSPNLSNIDLTIQETDNEENERNNNLNDVNTILISNAPNSPNNNTPSLIIPTEVLEETTSDTTKKLDNHPLSNCDVAFTFSGTRELKHIKNNKSLSRNSSPNLINSQ